MKRIILLLTFLLSAAYFYAQECVIVIPQLNGDTISVGMNSIKYIQAIQGGTVLMESEGAGTYTTSMSFDAVNAAANNRYLKYTDASSLRVYGIAVSNVKRILKASSGNAVILTKNGNYSFLTVEPYSTISGRGADCITIGVDAGVLADSMALLYAYVDANVGLSESEVASLVSDSIALINVMDTRLVQDTILEYYLDDLLVGKDTIRSKVPVAGDILATDAGGFFMTSPKNLENILQEMGDSLLQHLIRIQIMETLKMDAAEVRAIVSDTSQVLMARDTVSKLYRDSVLRYYLDGVVVGQDTIRPPGSGGSGGSSNSIYVISTLADTTTIIGEIEGDIAYVADTLMALRDDLYWLPFTGGGSGGSGLNESQVVAIVGDSAAVLRQLDTTSMIIQDSILVYRLQGVEIGRDTIRDNGITRVQVGEMIKDSLSISELRDTMTNLIQDSILVYMLNGIEKGRDTIRVPGSIGVGVSDFIKVDSTNDIAGMTAPLGSVIFNYENGATYKVQADTVAGYITDNIAVATVTGGYAVLQTDLGIDVKWFGAKDVVPFNSINNPTIVSYTPITADASDLAIYKAILFASLQKNSGGSANKRILFEGQFLVQDSSFTVPNGVEIWMVGNSYVHTNHNLPAFILDSHYGTSHRIKVTHKFFDGTTTGGMDWFPVSPATTEEDSTSVGIRVLNSRRCSFYDMSAMNFNKGIDVSGVATGCVENTFIISDIRNCKWGIYLDGDGGGWAHQNNFTGGRIKLDGTTGRNRAIDIDCGAIYTNGDNCTFTAINMEGSTHYKYAVYTNASSNKFINCRFEAVMAGQIYFTTNARDNEINGSYGFVNSTPWAKIPLYYSSDGVTYVQDSNLDDVYGRIIISPTSGYTIKVGGSIDLTGGINGVSDDGSGENVTLRLSMGQVGSEAAKYIETKMGRNDYSKTGFEINGSNELKYWGSSATAGSGKELKFEWEERGYTTTDKTYNIGEWYQRGDFVDVSGTSYLVAQSFKAVDSATEISNNILVANNGRRDPLVEFSKDGAWVEYFTRRQKDGNAYYDLPAFLYGFALTMSTDNIEEVTSGTSMVAYPAGKAGIDIKNTSGSGDVTVQLGLTNDYESGHIFYIACDKNSTSDIVITNNSEVHTLDGLSYTLKPYEFSIFIMFNQSGTRKYQEISRNRLNVSGTTGARPTLSSNDIGRKYFDTTLAKEIIWNGYEWISYKRTDDRIDVRDLGIFPNIEYSNAQLAVLTANENVKLYFPQDTFIFRNWQIIDKDNVDIEFDNTIIALPPGVSIDVSDTTGVDGFELPQISIVNVKKINISGKLLVDHSINSPSFIKPVSGEAAGNIIIVAGVDFANYGDVYISGITTKESYFVPLRIQSPQAWIHYDSLSWKNITIRDIHSDLSASLLLARVVTNNLKVIDCTMEIDRNKSIFGPSDETKALAITLDVASEAKVNVLINNLYSKYGGSGFFQNIQNVQIQNSVSDSWGYFPLSNGTDGNIVTTTWKSANPGLWDPLTMIEYAGGQSIKVDNYYYHPDRVFIIDNFEARNTNQHAGTYSQTLLVEGGNENLMVTDSYIDDAVKFASVPANPEGVARKALFNNCVFNETAELWLNRGTTVNNCVFRDTVQLASSGKQIETDTTGVWTSGVFVTTTDKFERVKLNNCTFTNRGVYVATDSRIQIDGCSFEGNAEINYGGTLASRAELIVKNSYGGRYRQSVVGTSDSLEIRFINHDRLGIGTTTFNNLFDSPLCELSNCLIINYDSTEVSDLNVSINQALTNRTKTPNDITLETVNTFSQQGLQWGNELNTEMGLSISSGALVIETDLPFTAAAYFLMKINFYRYYVTQQKYIGEIKVGSYLASVPDFYNPQAISVGEWGGTDQIKLAVNGSGNVVVIIGDVGDSYGSYACHFIFDALMYTDDSYAYDLSTWVIKSDTDISEYTVKKTLTNTQLNIPVISDAVYDATAWNGDTGAASKNAIRDKIELLAAGGSDGNGIYDGDGTAPADLDVAVTDSISIDNGTLFVNGITNKVGIANATPSEALDVTGNIAVSGTVDGRDLATDGSKLDGIEAGADVTDEANVVSSLNGATLTGVTVAGTDKVIIQDVSDSDNIKTVTAQSIADLASGSGDVVGPASSNDFEIAVFDGTTGKLLKTSAARASVAGDLSSINNLTLVGTLTMPAATNINMSGGGNIVLSGTGTVDGRDVATDGSKLDGIEAGADVTDATNVESAGALMDSEVDADIKTLNLPASTTISAFGASLVDDADAATARGTLGVDAAGTDNSTNVTLTGTGTYLSLLGQQITVDPITESDITDLNHFDGAYGSLTGTPTIPTVSDVAYDATSWDGNTDAATKNAIRDKIELLAAGGSDGNGIYDGDGTAPADLDVAVTDSINFGSGLLFIDGVNDKVEVSEALQINASTNSGSVETFKILNSVATPTVRGLSNGQFELKTSTSYWWKFYDNTLQVTNWGGTIQPMNIVSGTITAQYSGIKLANGSASAPSFAFYNGSGTGMYYPAANTIGFSMANANYVTFGINQTTFRNYVFNSDQTVGSGQDGYALIYNDGSGEIELTAIPGGGSPTSLSTGTVDATTYGISSDGGTDDVVLVEATTTTAGLLGAAKWNEIVANTAKVSNVNTSLSTGNITATTYGITSDGGTDDVVLAEATTTTAGLLGAAKWNEIVANTAKVSNVSTSLSTGTVTATTYGITSDGGANDVVLAEATTTTAGLLGASKWNEIVTNTAKISNATHTGEVTGATTLTVDKTAISNRTAVTAASTDYVLIGDASDSGNLKKALVSDLQDGTGTDDQTASEVSITDSGSYYSGSTVEAALDELGEATVPFSTASVTTGVIDWENKTDGVRFIDMTGLSTVTVSFSNVVTNGKYTIVFLNADNSDTITWTTQFKNAWDGTALNSTVLGTRKRAFQAVYDGTNFYLLSSY